MVRARFILFGLIVALGVGVWPFVTLLNNPTMIAHHGKSGLFFFLFLAEFFGLPSALFVFISTLFRVEISEGGELRYDPSNLFWRTICWVSDTAKNGAISLCKAFWIACVFTLFAYLIIIASFVAWAMYQIMRTEGAHKLWEIFEKAVPLVLGILGFFTLMYAIGKLSERNGIWGIMGKVLAWILSVVAAGAIIALPVLAIHSKNHASYLVAGLEWFGLLAAYVGLALFATEYASKHIVPYLRNSLLWRFLAARKENFCPTLYARQVAK